MEMGTKGDSEEGGEKNGNGFGSKYPPWIVPLSSQEKQHSCLSCSRAHLFIATHQQQQTVNPSNPPKL